VIKDSKLYWAGVATNTESSYWGEDLSLPVNATGDIVIEAGLRQKDSGSVFSIFPMGVNQGVLGLVRYGVESSVSYWYGRNNGANVNLPGYPAHNYIGPHGLDVNYVARVVRRNNYLFLYIDKFYMGSYAFAAPITTVDIGSHWGLGVNDWKTERWIDYISVWPREVVTGGP
jgi:hypothetical protein